MAKKRSPLQPWKSQRFYRQNIGWILLFLLHGCRSAQLDRVCCVAWRRRMVGHCYEVCQQHIWFGWTLVSEDYSGRTHPIITAALYMHLPPSISSALIPLFFLSMNHPSACPHFRVSPNLALFWSRPCVVVKSLLETRSSMSPLRCPPCCFTHDGLKYSFLMLIQYIDAHFKPNLSAFFSVIKLPAVIFV